MKKMFLFVIGILLFIPVCFAEEINEKAEPTTTTTITTIETTTTPTTKTETTTKKVDKKQDEKVEDNLLTDGKSYILIEQKTGKVILEKNAHDRYAPASMTKIMSMILIMESIENGRIKWNDKLVTSEYAASMGGSQIFLQPNEKMSVKDLFKAVAIGSANDATVVFAETIAGSEKKFVEKMNEKAKKLGLKDTNFKNAVGLDEANHYSSAYDMAMMARELVKHEQIFKFTTIYEDYLRQNTDNKFWLVNTNKLIKTYSGADGLKTGYTKEAGYCLTATAKKNNMRLIGTIMGASDSNTRNTNMAKLLDYGFNLYEMQVEVKKGRVVSYKKLSKAKNELVKIIAKDDLSILIEKGDNKKGLNYDIDISKLKLPIKEGSKVGTLYLKDKNKVIASTDLTVKEDVLKASILELYKRSIKSILTGDM